MPTILWIAIIAVVAVICFILGVLYRKKVAEREIFSAKEEAKRLEKEHKAREKAEKKDKK